MGIEGEGCFKVVMVVVGLVVVGFLLRIGWDLAGSVDW